MSLPTPRDFVAGPSAGTVSAPLNLSGDALTISTLTVETSQGAGQSQPVVHITTDNAAIDQSPLKVESNANTHVVQLVRTGGNPANGNVLLVTAPDGAAMDTTLGVSGYETGKGTIKVTHNKPEGAADGNASAISIKLDQSDLGVASSAQGIFLDTDANHTSTAKLLNIRHGGTERLTLTAAGTLRLGGSGFLTSDTGILEVKGTTNGEPLILAAYNHTVNNIIQTPVNLFARYAATQVSGGFTVGYHGITSTLNYGDPAGGGTDAATGTATTIAGYIDVYDVGDASSEWGALRGGIDMSPQRSSIVAAPNGILNNGGFIQFVVADAYFNYEVGDQVRVVGTTRAEANALHTITSLDSATTLTVATAFVATGGGGHMYRVIPNAGGDAGRAWATDITMLGPVDNQAALLQGCVIGSINRASGAPANGPSVGLVVVTKQTIINNTAPSFAFDIGIAVVGNSGSAGTGVGHEVAIKVGGYASGWMESGRSLANTGVEITDFDTNGLLIWKRNHATTGQAISIGWDNTGAASQLPVDGILFGGDTNFYRGGGTLLKTDHSLSVGGEFRTPHADFTLTVTAGVNNDIGIGSRSFVRIIGDTGNFSISSIGTPNDGQRVILYYLGTNNMTLTHEAGTGTAANRLHMTDATNRVSTGEAIAEFIYDSSISRWLLLSWIA